MNRTNQKHYLKIGEVAKLNRISTATLRYYDQIGLFSPAHTTESGYRYYSVDAMPFALNGESTAVIELPIRLH